MGLRVKVGELRGWGIWDFLSGRDNRACDSTTSEVISRGKVTLGVSNLSGSSVRRCLDWSRGESMADEAAFGFDDSSSDVKLTLLRKRHPLSSAGNSSSNPSFVIDSILWERYRGVKFEFFPGEPKREVLLAMEAPEEGES